MAKGGFDWDPAKDRTNRLKHVVDFQTAQMAFSDRNRVIAVDTEHSSSEKRYFCFGRVGAGVLTVRFTYRTGVIRIFGAGYWRKGKQIYDRQNQVHGCAHRQSPSCRGLPSAARGPRFPRGRSQDHASA